jgi:hypothetical protein
LLNRLNGTIINTKASSEVNSGLESIGICSFSTKQTTLQVKNND